MRWSIRWLFAMIMMVSQAYAQDTRSVSSGLPAMDSVLTAEDSLSIFSLIDSLLQLDDEAGSQLAIRISYNSNVLSAGRTLGISNFGLAPGISYYHTSGIYADVTGYWSKDFEPSYYLTVASLGYMRDLSDKFYVMLGYDRYFYETDKDNIYIPYRNTLSLTPVLSLEPFAFSVNYSFYFGDAHVHRIMPGLSVNLEKKRWKNIDRIAITPSFFVLFGNETITEIRYPETIRDLIRRLRQGQSWYDQIDKNVFGIMNYTFSIPMSVSVKKWTFGFTYSYNIPKALPGEPDALSESSYVSGSLSYFIDFR
jgi:hypothetical protein